MHLAGTTLNSELSAVLFRFRSVGVIEREHGISNCLGSRVLGCALRPALLILARVLAGGATRSSSRASARAEAPQGFAGACSALGASERFKITCIDLGVSAPPDHRGSLCL